MLTYEYLCQIESRWNSSDTGSRRPGHIAACTDIMLLCKEVRRLKLEAERVRTKERQSTHHRSIVDWPT